MVKIFHEAPKLLFYRVQPYSEVDVGSVKAFETDDDYYEMFQESQERNRSIILTNRNKPLPLPRYAYWLKHLKPTWYFLPDVQNSFEETADVIRMWEQTYSADIPSKRIGILQGKSFEQLANCYKFLTQEIGVDMISIPADLDYYGKSIKNPNPVLSSMLGRIRLLGDLEHIGLINELIPHNILDVVSPFEGHAYLKYPWIHSVLTANPILDAIRGELYKEGIGTLDYLKQNPDDLLDAKEDIITKTVVHEVLNNIRIFRQIWTQIKLD
jgi:hypothetical protein